MPPRPRAVDPRGFDQALIDVLQRRQEVDHVEADVHPQRRDHDRRHDQRRVGQPVLLQPPADQRLQEPVEQPVARREEHREQDADEHLPDEVRREDRQAEEALRAGRCFALSSIASAEAQRQLEADRAEREEGRVPQRLVEVGVAQDEAEVAPARRTRGGGAVGLVEREDRRVDQRVEEEDER